MKYAGVLGIALISFLLAPASFASLVYTPAKLDRAQAKVVVVIHGCLQSAESMALGTGWNQIADQNHLIILYPQVPEGSNPIGCWSWYLPENQRADGGQLKAVMDEVAAVKRQMGLGDVPLYVAGISSGAATAAGLLACYPQHFTAGAIHSGPSYALAQNLVEGEKVLKEGPAPGVSSRGPCQPRDFTGSVQVIQGDADVVVNPKNAIQVMWDFVGSRESVSTKKTKEKDGTEYTVSSYSGQNGVRGRVVMISGLGHAWSGFVSNLRFAAVLGPRSRTATQIPFFSDLGPSATNLMWDFFRDSPRKPAGNKTKK